jgi:uncharacterized protein (TIGR00730 family)
MRLGAVPAAGNRQRAAARRSAGTPRQPAAPASHTCLFRPRPPAPLCEHRSMALQRICVYSGSTPGGDPAYVAAAAQLGALLAERGIGIVYGGGRAGLMGAVADAALAAGGEVIGVLPRLLDQREIGHRGLTELRVVDSMHARKAEMATLADAFVALPGGLGTLEELVEAATWTQLGIHAKPVGLLDVARYWQDLEALLDHAVREGFLRPQNRGLVVRNGDPELLLDALERWTPPAGATLTDRDDAAAGPGATLGPDALPPGAGPPPGSDATLAPGGGPASGSGATLGPDALPPGAGPPPGPGATLGLDALIPGADARSGPVRPGGARWPAPVPPGGDGAGDGADIADPASPAAAGPPHPPPHPPPGPLARGIPAPPSGTVVPFPTIRPPAVGVSALVIRDGRILLGQRRGAHGAGTWAPPGGAVDGGERPADTALRELEEETGLRGERARPLVFTSDLFPRDRQQWVTLHHLVEGATGEPRLREPDRSGAWRWFALEELPQPLFGPLASLVQSDAWPPRS